MKVVAVNGSPRPMGNTFQAIQTVLNVIESAGIETEILRDRRTRHPRLYRLWWLFGWDVCFRG
ncbi:MAG: NAD(P)H-dependent oxidoreductase [Clostridia bacterium]